MSNCYLACNKTVQILQEDLGWSFEAAIRETQYLLRYAGDRKAYEVLAECIPMIVDAFVRFETPMAVSLTQHIDYRDKTQGVPHSADVVSNGDWIDARIREIVIGFYACPGQTYPPDSMDEYRTLRALQAAKRSRPEPQS